MKQILIVFTSLFLFAGSSLADVAGGPSDAKKEPGDIKVIDQGLPTQDPDAVKPGIPPGEKAQTKTGTPPHDQKLLLPAVKEYRIELGKARFKMARFDPSKGLDLFTLTPTKVSIPAMKEIVKEMGRKAGDIKSQEFREEMLEHIKNLGALLTSQENNRTDKDGMADAFDAMEEILDQMEKPGQ